MDIKRKFQRDDIVKCYDDGWFEDQLTLGKEYLVLRLSVGESSGKPLITIIDDQGNDFDFDEHRFDFVRHSTVKLEYSDA